MKRSMLFVFLAVFLGQVSCAHNPGPLKRVRTQIGDVQTPNSIPLFIGAEVDRSGNDYRKRLHDFDVESIKDRLSAALSGKDIEVLVETLQAGVPAKVRYVNPFSPVDDSSKAQVVLRLYVDGFRFSSEYTEGQKMVGPAFSAPHGVGLQLHVSVQGVSAESNAEIFQFAVDVSSGGTWSVTKKYERDAAIEVLDITTDRILKKLLKP